jgi:hypothetical protein
MATEIKHDASSVLFEGGRLPVEQLDPARFEDFIFACLVCLETHLGIRITAQPSGSGDGGFDVQGLVTATSRVACVQCKRQAAKLGRALLAVELAKSAATAALENADIGEHMFICTGGVTQELRGLLRSTSRDEIVAAVAKALTNSTDSVLAALRVRLAAEAKTAAAVAEAYVRGLDSITVWGLRELDSMLSVRWDDIIQLADRFFRIASVVREHPRANFDRMRYAEQHVDYSVVVEPRVGAGELPSGIATSSAQDPAQRSAPGPRRSYSLRLLLDLAPGESALVVADGGMGKSTLLRLIRTRMLNADPDAALPIIVPCAEYVPGNLDALVHRQLAISYGTWRTLPDRIVLLCDGLNEAGRPRLEALLSELAPLLDQKRVACVFTSRAEGRAARLVLPTIAACMQLQPLTPVGVQNLAESKLADESKAGAFTDAYVKLAELAASPILWTPFAVLVAIADWRDSGQLPDSLAKLLEAFLRARASRDAELQDSVPEHVGALSNDVALELARAIAFEMMVVRGCLSCAMAEAGKVLLTAKRACAHALGVDALSSSDIEVLLRRHDLVQRSPQGNIRLSHQLVAGALAAPELARMWKHHLRALEDSVADDAWVMAARLVDQQEVPQYLEALFNADLILGARAAATLPRAYHHMAVGTLVRALKPEAPELVQVHALFALANIGSDEARAVLKLCAADEDNLVVQSAAKRALATSGEPAFLRELAEKVDRLRRGGRGISGGEISVWEAASLPMRLRFARERLRLCAPGEPMNESLMLIAHERNPDDLPAVEAHLAAATDLDAWRTSLAAINMIAEARAQQLYDDRLAVTSAVTERIVIMETASSLGLSVDVRRAFHDVLAEAKGHKRSGPTCVSVRNLVDNLLRRTQLASDLVLYIETELPVTSGEKHERLWHIAEGVCSDRVANYALQVLRARGKNSWAACNFLIAQASLREQHAPELTAICEAYLADRTCWFSFESYRVLALMGNLKFTSAAAACLRGMLARLDAIRAQVEAGNLPELSASEQRELGGKELDTARISLSRLAALLVPSVAHARDLLTDDDILILIRFDIKNHSNAPEQMAIALERVPPERVDDVLTQLDDSWVRKSALLIAASFPPTPVRINLLRQELLASYCHPAALHTVLSALECCWNRTVCEMVVGAVAAITDWPPEYEQFFWEFANVVADRVTPADLETLERAEHQAQTSFAGRILRIWCHAAQGSRLGLGLL